MITSEKLAELYEIYCNHPVVVTDSRKIIPGSLFFALRGASFDGNRFAADSLRKGAVLAIVDEVSVMPVNAKGETLTHEQAVAKGFFLVEDVLITLQQLAALHRTTIGIPILAITGTNGKTTTKELTAAVLSQKFNLYATQGNLNNHIGVPLTLLSIKPDAELGIVEMGASAQREIALLCDIAKPDYGIITNVGRAHLEGFGGEEGVKIAKGELYDYLVANHGRAFVRREDENLTVMAAQRTGMNVDFYDIDASNSYESNLAGDYNAMNVAAAISIGRFFGVEEESIRCAIKNYIPNANRSQVIDTGRNLLIADCYNANPSSMKAALEWFGMFEPEQNRECKTIVLGDMFELGEWSLNEHTIIIKAALDVKPQKLILLGKIFSKVLESFVDSIPEEVTVLNYIDAPGFIDDIKNGRSEITGSSVLLKGSRGMALEKLIEFL